ncbi:MAG: amidohydrolase family protein [Spirochaetaceae bacterium]|nr:amidohydrolase family protein [Myxococcales bacterium]MCB9726829.1 amidohydrolase family protein [Spirochaetaceae bacterium]HPG27516.1 amidohydrolase family protein [Myxococcota bacterium]
MHPDRLRLRATTTDPERRRFLRELAFGLAWTAGLGSAASLAGCDQPDPDRYTQADVEALAAQRLREREQSGRGRFGPHRYRGYRGLAELPWFELDERGRLRCVDESLPLAIDCHSHFGMSVLFEPELDLQARTERVRHLLDCDATEPGCALDLDVYVNANFDDEALEDLECTTLTQGLWGNDVVRTQTLPNLLDEMDAMRVEQAIVLPIAFHFPFGDDLTTKWRDAIAKAGAGRRLLAGASVHPRDPDKITKLESFAAAGARVIKMHPTVQAFYPDEDDAFEIYQAAERLGLVVFFHGGRAGIEPESRLRYALPRHYEGAFSTFPRLPFVIGHAGARDGEAMLDLATGRENVWLGLHGQGLSRLDEIIRRTQGERLLFGTDWPFYHLAASLAKILIVTDEPGRESIRHAILRGNAERLLAA